MFVSLAVRDPVMCTRQDVTIIPQLTWQTAGGPLARVKKQTRVPDLEISSRGAGVLRLGKILTTQACKLAREIGGVVTVRPTKRS